MAGRRTLRALGILAGFAVASGTVCVAAVAVLSLRVEGVSMSPTLADGQRILVAPGSGGRAARFDIVVLTQPGTGVRIVKRVVAVAGDAIAINGAAVTVRPGNAGPWRRVVNGAWAAQWHQTTACCDGSGREDPGGGAVVVPAGTVFVLGDNPDASEDSRDFGWVDLASVQGRVVLSAWPPGRLEEESAASLRG